MAAPDHHQSLVDADAVRTPPVRLSRRRVAEDREGDTDPQEAAATALGAPSPEEPTPGVADLEELLEVLAEPVVDETGEFEMVDEPRRGRLPRGRVKARRVRRIVRYVSPWSVFKVALLFYLCLWMIFSVAGVILWQVAEASGTIGNAEDFLAQLFAQESFTIDGRQMFRATAVSGILVVFAGTGFTVLMALLFNAIADITGGLRFTVLELESARREVRRSALERREAKAARRSGPAAG